MSNFRALIEGKRVALVGPAKYINGSNYGADIDSKDIVARINRGIESIDTYSDDVGRRTDIYYSCLIERAQQTGVLNPIELISKYGIKYVVAPPSSDFQGISRSTSLHNLVDVAKVQAIAAKLPVRIIDHRFHTDLATQVECKPNTGFLAIYDLLAMAPKELSIYGFSFYLDGFLPGQKSGIESEKNCSEQEFADMAFNSKRHIQENMWRHAKNTLLDNSVVRLDKTLETILKMKTFNRKEFEKARN